jgi:UDP-N-acetylmuramoyl-tripeptide--D-alanyl-D-alanine ligase
MKIEELYNLFLECSGVSTDTRTIKGGELFIALKGQNFNGNRYALEALQKGAKYALVDESIEGSNIILCDNCLQTLQHLATHHRREFTKPLIALTGSNGKTTSKELIACVLSTHLKTHSTSGNLNNHIGVPLSLLALPLDSDIAIIEMGANHQKEIDQLSHIAEPDYGIITNIGKAHLEGFGGIEGVIKGKSELYDYIKKTNGTIIFNAEDPILKKQVGHYSKHITYFPSTLSVETDDFGYLTITHKDITYALQLTGDYNLANISCAIRCGLEFGIPVEESLRAITAYVPDNNRSEIKQIGDIKVIMDAYNANPTSMKASLKSFHNIKAEEKIIFMGEMLELGEASLAEHQEIVDFIQELHSDYQVFLIGTAWEHVNTDYKKFENVDVFMERTNLREFSAATILLKGSRGVRLEKILKQLG